MKDVNTVIGCPRTKDWGCDFLLLFDLFNYRYNNIHIGFHLKVKWKKEHFVRQPRTDK